MAEKDLSEKILEDYNDVFADIYNTLLFQEPLLQEDKLDSGPTESIYKAEHGELKDQHRDILKVHHDSYLMLLSLGIENQSTIDKYMPLRIMGYDYATYRSHLQNNGILHPVITIVLNFSDKRWDAPLNLYSLMNLPHALEPYVQNYKIKVFDISFLEDEIIERFTSDFKLVAKFFKQKRLGQIQNALQDNTTVLKHTEATLNLLRVFTNDNRYAMAYTESIKSKVQKGENVTMCSVLDYIEQQAELRMLISLVQEDNYPIEKAAKRAELSISEFEQIMKTAGTV